MDFAPSLPLLSRVDDAVPHVRILSNGSYAVLLSGAGTGYSVRGELRLTAWSGDRTEDSDGLFIYVRDRARGWCVSLGHQPMVTRTGGYDSSYSPGCMEIVRRHDGIEARMEVCVAPDDDVELRRVTLRNHTDQPRHIELTTYAEVVLNYAAAHAAHPAFSKLFVQTEYVETHSALLARRRPRSAAERWPWLLHTLTGSGPPQYESDRKRFIGRGRTVGAPDALTSTAPLSGTAGNVLDPIFSLRRTIALAAGESVQCTALLGAADSRDAVLQLAACYCRDDAVQRAFAGAAERERGELRRLRVNQAQAEYLQALGGAMLYGDPALRAPAAVLQDARGSTAELTRYGLRADRLFAIASIERPEQAGLVDELEQAQAYWATRGLAVDLVILAADAAHIAATDARSGPGRPDHTGVLALPPRDQLPAGHLDLLQACAPLVIAGAWPQLTQPAAAVTARARTAVTTAAVHTPPTDPGLRCFNGYGGFTADGREYVIRLGAGERPPMPWINVIANDGCGCLVSESGATYTWSRNSREHRLTPWYNDPVSDPYGEALYIRDEDAGVFWSPLPGPTGSTAAEVRHGFGYSAWRSHSDGIEQEVTRFVPLQDPLQITSLRLTNRSDRPRRLSLFAYHRLVLGPDAQQSARFVVTQHDAAAEALLARNACAEEFSDGVTFLAAVPPPGGGAVHYTGDRTAFIGRNGSPAAPAALFRAADLDGRTGAGMDPCAAVQMRCEIPAHGTVECAVLFGETTSLAAVRALLGRYRNAGALRAAYDGVQAFWQRTLSAVEVHTPAPELDLMVNGWLLYQVLSCRLWARSAFYQSGGAFGFRDQLQDAAALIYTRPDLTRAQIALHAAHQFTDGDILHWWHPPASRGIRTRFSDDLLWLPYLSAQYVHRTGDWSILDDPAGFLAARPLAPGEDEAYVLPTAAAEPPAPIYEHCCRALDRSLTRGAHGLPLMGTGDWNDGMNRVGREGRGESVWLGFFLCCVLDEFIPICARRADHGRVQRYRAYRAALADALNDAGWDGQWYRRAYYDDGTPLGSASNQECRIDALAQAWAVLSRVAPPERAAQAMDAVEHCLVNADAGLIKLLTPAFDHDPHDPGYIKGYVPGIRENGGQYTHAAVWVVQALAELGRRDRAAAYLEMLGPVWHTRSPERVAVYQVEPYVLAADIYGEPPHVGRGGWTWYTGSAGWMYRVAIESILGLRLADGNTLWLRPRIPDAWPAYRITYRLPDDKTVYDIAVRNPHGRAERVTAVSIDGTGGRIEDGAARIVLQKDGASHRVEVTVG